MSETDHVRSSVPRPWDARLARWLVTPLRHTRVAPNHLTTLRLLVGVGAAGAFIPGTYVWSMAASLLLVVSNFLDHTDGELARISGRTSRFGHLYDLASDALVTVTLFVAIGVGLAGRRGVAVDYPILGAVAGTAIAVIFYLRMQIEDAAGKAETRQPSLLGFETEDVFYLLPLVTLCNGLEPMLITASICAPLYALWTVVQHRRISRRLQILNSGGELR